MKIGTGWLGWSEADTLDTEIATIWLAWEGRQEMLQAIFGGTPAADKPALYVMPASAIGSIFRLMGNRKAVA